MTNILFCVRTASDTSISDRRVRVITFHLCNNECLSVLSRLLFVSKAQNPMEKRAVAYFRLGSHPSLSATLRCLFTIRKRALMCAAEPLVFGLYSCFGCKTDVPAYSRKHIDGTVLEMNFGTTSWKPHPCVPLLKTQKHFFCVAVVRFVWQYSACVYLTSLSLHTWLKRSKIFGWIFFWQMASIFLNMEYVKRIKGTSIKLEWWMGSSCVVVKSHQLRHHMFE